MTQPKTFIRYKQRGASLIEICIISVLIGILILKGLQSFRDLLMYQECALTLEKLQGMILIAKNEAMRRKTTITLCGSSNHITCHLQDDWSKGFIMFENKNEEKGPSDPSKIIHSSASILANKSLHYGKLMTTLASTHHLLHIHSNGMTMNLGAFIYAPFFMPAHNNDFNQKLIINHACRSYRKSH